MESATAKSYLFTLTLEMPPGVDLYDESVTDAVYDAGCGDATLGVCEGVSTAAFDRAADTYDAAVASATAAVEGAVPGLKVIAARPEPDPTPAERVRAARHADPFVPFEVVTADGRAVRVDDPDATALGLFQMVVIRPAGPVEVIDLASLADVRPAGTAAVAAG